MLRAKFSREERRLNNLISKFETLDIKSENIKRKTDKIKKVNYEIIVKPNCEELLDRIIKLMNNLV